MEMKETLYERLHIADTFDLNARNLSLKIKVLAREQNQVYAFYGKNLANYLYFAFHYLDKTCKEKDLTVENILKLYLIDINEAEVFAKVVKQRSVEHPEVGNAYEEYLQHKPDMPENTVDVILDAFEEYCERAQIEFDRDECEANVLIWAKKRF